MSTMDCTTCRGRGETPGRTISGRITCADCLGTGVGDLTQRRIAQAKEQAQEVFDLAKGLGDLDCPPVNIRFNDAVVIVHQDGTATYETLENIDG